MRLEGCYQEVSIIRLILLFRRCHTGNLGAAAGDKATPSLEHERQAGRTGALDSIINRAGEIQNENQMRSLSRRSKYPNLGMMVRRTVENCEWRPAHLAYPISLFSSFPKRNNAIGKPVPQSVNGEPRMEPGKHTSCLLDKTQDGKRKNFGEKIKKDDSSRSGLPGVGLSTEFMWLPGCRAQPAAASTGGS